VNRFKRGFGLFLLEAMQKRRRLTIKQAKHLVEQAFLAQCHSREVPDVKNPLRVLVEAGTWWSGENLLLSHDETGFLNFCTTLTQGRQNPVNSRAEPRERGWVSNNHPYQMDSACLLDTCKGGPPALRADNTGGIGSILGELFGFPIALAACRPQSAVKNKARDWDGYAWA
jgi:hypothetical protein